MKLNRTSLDGVIEIIPTRHTDTRGHFAETFRQDWFAKNVEDVTFVQENTSLSALQGTLRGLHFQSEPSAQGKLVTCAAGAIYDVAVDIRKHSSQFGQWTAVSLLADVGNQLWIPPGFLHGFYTLAPNTIVSYKVTSYYDSSSDRGVRWDDPDIAIEWPGAVRTDLMSLKDIQQPLLRDLQPPFTVFSE